MNGTPVERTPGEGQPLDDQPLDDQSLDDQPLDDQSREGQPVVGGPGRGAVAGQLRWVEAAVLAGLVALTRLPGLVASRAFNADEATLATGGRVWAGGGSLYVDLIDRKPPLPFAIYGLTFDLTGSGDLRWVRLLVALLILASALLVASEARRRWGTRAGWVAGIVLVLGASALGPNDAQAANFELFALLPIAVAVVAAARGGAVVAGAALAVAVLCKQPAAVTVVPVAWSLWHAGGREGRWRRIGVGLLAGAITGLAVAAAFVVSRVLEWALLGTGGYVGLSLSDLGFAAGRLAGIAAVAAGFWAGAWLLVAVARGPVPSAGAVRDRGDGGVDRDADLWLLMAVSVVALVPGFRFFPHYLVQLLPAVALLAARGATRRPVLVRPALALGVAASLVAAALAWSHGLAAPPAFERDVAAFVRDNTAATDTILVWGNVPEIYWRADRVPAGGFTHTEFVTGYSGGRVHEVAREDDLPDEELYRDWVDRLRRDPPALVVDTAAAGIRGGDHFPLANFPSLVEVLDGRYERVATIEGVPVYGLIHERGTR